MGRLPTTNLKALYAEEAEILVQLPLGKCLLGLEKVLFQVCL